MVEWRDLFSYDDLRGKVLLGYACLLSSIELRHLSLFVYAVHYFATKSSVSVLTILILEDLLLVVMLLIDLAL